MSSKQKVKKPVKTHEEIQKQNQKLTDTVNAFCVRVYKETNGAAHISFDKHLTRYPEETITQNIMGRTMQVPFETHDSVIVINYLGEVTMYGVYINEQGEIGGAKYVGRHRS